MSVKVPLKVITILFRAHWACCEEVFETHSERMLLAVAIPWFSNKYSPRKGTILGSDEQSVNAATRSENSPAHVKIYLQSMI